MRRHFLELWWWIKGKVLEWENASVWSEKNAKNVPTGPTGPRCGLEQLTSWVAWVLTIGDGRKGVVLTARIVIKIV